MSFYMLFHSCTTAYPNLLIFFILFHVTKFELFFLGKLFQSWKTKSPISLQTTSTVVVKDVDTADISALF